MEALSFFDAVGLWLRGDLSPDHTMGPLPIFAWARIGEFLSFCGGITIILDILGEEKIRKIGRKMRDLIDFRSEVVGMFYTIVHAVEQVPAENKLGGVGRVVAGVLPRSKFGDRVRRQQTVREFFEWDSRREKLRQIEERMQRMTPTMVVLVILGALLFGLRLATRYATGALSIFLWLAFIGFFAWAAILVLGPLLTFAYAAVRVIVSLVFLLVDVVVDWIADWLMRKDNGTVLRIAGLGLLVVGFPLDLLGS